MTNQTLRKVKSSKQRSRERQQIAKTDALASWQAARQEKLANAVSKAMGLFSKLMNDTDSAVSGTVLTKRGAAQVQSVMAKAKLRMIKEQSAKAHVAASRASEKLEKTKQVSCEAKIQLVQKNATMHLKHELARAEARITQANLEMRDKIDTARSDAQAQVEMAKSNMTAEVEKVKAELMEEVDQQKAKLAQEANEVRTKGQEAMQLKATATAKMQELLEAGKTLKTKVHDVKEKQELTEVSSAMDKAFLTHAKDLRATANKRVRAAEQRAAESAQKAAAAQAELRKLRQLLAIQAMPQGSAVGMAPSVAVQSTAATDAELVGVFSNAPDPGRTLHSDAYALAGVESALSQAKESNWSEGEVDALMAELHENGFTGS